jgi:hypothetical protein
MAMVTEGHGARVINRVQNSGAMFLHCLVERAIILEDDQAKRIGEELLPANDDGTRQELTVRASAPTDEDEALDQQAESKYDKGVMDKLDSWINKRDYKPKDCPLPGSVDVGSVASALDILGLSLVCAFLWMGVDGTTHGRNDREELGLNIGGYRGAPDSGEFGTLIKQILNLLAIELYKVSQSLIISSMCRYIGTIMENHTGQSGPRTELLEILGWFTHLRKRQRLLGFKEEHLSYLYDCPVFVVDNCKGNRGETGGLIAMIDIARRHEYLYLKQSSRQNIGKYVATVTQSCQLHDSNLINVELSRMLRELDLTLSDPFNVNTPPLETIRGNKSTESFSYNAARFLAGGMKKNKDWKAFMLDTYGDAEGIKPIKSARFWAAMLVGGYLYKRIDFLEEFMELKNHADLQLGGTLEEVRTRLELFRWDCPMGADGGGVESGGG